MNVVGIEEAQKAVLANMTPRAKDLDALERYVEGTQYVGRPSWWEDKVPVPERAPCIVYKIVSTAIASNVDLVLGEGRFPEATTNPGENDEAFDDSGLNEDDSSTVDRGLLEIQKQTRFRAVCREALAAAQGCGTAVAIAGVRSGRLFVDTVRAKWAERDVDVEGRVKRLVIQYPYTVTERQRDGTWRVKAMVYRRVLTETEDVTMLPAAASSDGATMNEEDWTPDPAQSFQHNLGFCPVVWYAHMRGSSTIDEIDGHAIHALSRGEIEAHDLTLSMRHRAAVYGGDPTLCEYGVESGYNPASTGRTPGVPATATGGKPSSDNPVVGAYQPVQTSPARKKGISQVWQYENDKARAEYLVLHPDAVKVLDENAHDLRQKICEALAVVQMDPENVKFAATVSGKALETLRERQLNRCDQIRDDFGDGFILPVLAVLLRIVSVTVRTGGALRLAGADKLAKVLKKYDVDNDNDGWSDPLVTLRWGDYFKPDADDEAKVVATTVAARNASIITKRMALEKVRRIFGIQSIEQAEQALKDEADEHGSLEAAMHAMTADDDDDDDEQVDRKKDRSGAAAA